MRDETNFRLTAVRKPRDHNPGDGCFPSVSKNDTWHSKTTERLHRPFSGEDDLNIVGYHDSNDCDDDSHEPFQNLCVKGPRSNLTDILLKLVD